MRIKKGVVSKMLRKIYLYWRWMRRFKKLPTGDNFPVLNRV